jgi:Second Messenger Oligonucleotide or Dinucleotide Synthetase domain/Adenylyl/Guanylyl and SMODS C-terminal sensor domain
MKLISHFDTFLDDVVNLNQTRLDTLEKRVATISEFLRKSDYEPRIRRFSPQGSYAHKTIIKPPGTRDYDADLLVIVDRVSGWSAVEYVEKLYSLFRASGTYRDIVSRNTRCVVLDYANDFHLDVVPCIQDISGETRSFWVCNRLTDRFERTAPEKYNEWLATRNSITTGNSLRKCTRLIKYLRDIKTTFSIKSILLTTLLGSQVNTLYPASEKNQFPDVPTALRTLFGRLDDYLQARPVMPAVVNPVLSSEAFNRHWDQDKYTNFRDRIHTYREWIDDAYREEDRDSSIRKWRRAFGDDFAEGEVAEKAAAVAAVTLNEAGANSGILVERVRRLGKRVLNAVPLMLPHVQPLPWPLHGQLAVEVQANEGGRAFASGDILQKGRSLQFRAHVPSGLPNGYEIRWRVVNTGEEAVRARQLRGTFYHSYDRIYRDEPTKYTGVHWVEAFIVNMRNRTCVGRSERFFVVIQ